VSFLVTVPIVVVMVVTETPLVIVVLLVVSGYFVQLGVGLFYTHVRELVGEHVAGSALAVLTMASFTGGFTAPVIAGWLIGVSGSYLTSFGFAFGLALSGVVLAWLAPEP
jgi:MFS family permease